ncbi:MAG TPA: hypothetical protein VIJ50_08170 [Solirubrobacteraceae bacterium]
MPTTRARHTITETPPVQEALDELRAKLGEGERIDFAELVALGARVKAIRTGDREGTRDEAKASAARQRLVERLRSRSFPYELDIAAAEEVKHLGLIANYE